MKNFLGAIFAAVLDMWLPLFITMVLVLGLMKMAQAEEAAPDPSLPYDTIAVAVGSNGLIMIQRGQFACRDGEHRAIFIAKSQAAKLGCASISDSNVHIDWEIGPAADIPKTAPGHTDGPAQELPAHPGATPERNS